MSRTIGYRWSRSRKGDYPVRCDICGVPWPRSRCTKSADGKVLCPQDRGPTVAELDRANAEASKARAGYHQSAQQDRAHGQTDLSSWKSWEAIKPTSSGYSADLTGYYEVGVSALTLEGGKVIAWGDASGSGHTVSRVEGQEAPSLDSSFHASFQGVKFTGIGEILTNPGYTSQNPASYLALVRVDDIPEGHDAHIFDSTDQTQRHVVHWYGRHRTAGLLAPYANGASAQDNSGLIVLDGMYASITFVFNGDDSWISLNGRYSLNLPSGTNYRNGIAIGSDPYSEQGLKASIRALAVYDRVVSLEESDDLHNGFRLRSGLPIIGEKPW